MINASKQPILTAKQMHKADQFTIDHNHISAAKLMEYAGHALAAASNKHKLDGGRFVFMIGSGNNGGDGLVAARLLRNKQVPVTVIPLFPLDKLHGEIAHQLELARKAGVKIRPATSANDLPQLDAWLKRAVIVVDAIFGTGLTRPITGWVAEAIVHINKVHCPILAVDIPSGIHADTGQVLGAAIQANVTLPIAAYKWGHWLRQGKQHSGLMLTPASIGITPTTLQQMLADYPITAVASLLIDKHHIQAAFPPRATDAHKQIWGHLWVFGGSMGYTGAPRLAAKGAQAVGTGLVSIACPTDVYPIIAASSLETMVHPQEQAIWQLADVIVAGPGWGKTQQTTLTTILNTNTAVLLDADALNMLATDETLQTILIKRTALTVLTPHPGEAARLLGITSADVQQDRLASILNLVAKYNTWVVLKGEHTLVASPSKQIWLNPFGSVNLAVAGTGDVLSGMIGGLLATGLNPETAIPAAVGLHGLAGEQQGWHKAGQLEHIIAMHAQKLRQANQS